MRHLCDSDKEDIITACQTKTNYVYLHKLADVNKQIKTADYYLGVLFSFDYDCDLQIEFIEVKIIQHYSKWVCKDYLHNTLYNMPNFVEDVKPGTYLTLSIVKQLVRWLQQHTILQIRFEVRDPQLIRIYKSRKGFGDELKELTKEHWYYL